LQTCSRCNTQSSDLVQTCPKCGADLSRYSTVAASLAKLRANPRVSMIRVSVYDRCCPACAAAQGAHEKDSVPILPIEGCSGVHGCRCFYEPVLTEIYP
jgi:hypothetical protein